MHRLQKQTLSQYLRVRCDRLACRKKRRSSTAKRIHYDLPVFRLSKHTYRKVQREHSIIWANAI
jgi:hypothetical protein